MIVKELLPKLLFAFLLLSVNPLGAGGGGAPDMNRPDSYSRQDSEIPGRVEWILDPEDARMRSGSEGKPILLLVQNETKNGEGIEYWEAMLSQPLIVEAVESLFVPFAVKTNGGEKDRWLSGIPGGGSQQFLIRITDRSFNDLIERITGIGGMQALLSSMILALESQSMDVPEYVRILYVESMESESRETALFPVHCFWAGEVELGPSSGILETTPGRIGNREVVEVVFDKSVTSYGELLEESCDLGLSENAYALNDEQERVASELMGPEKVTQPGEMTPDKKPKYYLRRTTYRYVPMTERQAILVNSDIFLKRDPQVRLSPRQIRMHEFIKNHKNRKWKNQIGSSDLTESWEELTKRIYRISGGDVYIH